MRVIRVSMQPQSSAFKLKAQELLAVLRMWTHYE